MNKSKSGSDPPAAASGGNAPGDATAPAEIEFELSLEDTLSQRRRGVTPQGRKAPLVGYDPYDTPLKTGTPSAPPPDDGKRKPKDLRKLSEWIRLQRQVKALKKDDEPEPE